MKPLAMLTIAIVSLLGTFASAGATNEPLLYVPNYNEVDVYPVGVRKPKILTKLTHGEFFFPVSVSLDTHGNLYALSNNGEIFVFARGATSPFRTIAAPSGFFSLGGLCVARDGSIYLVDAASQNAERAIVQIDKTSKILRTILFPNANPFDVTTDAAGNLFASVDTNVLVFAPGQTTPMATIPQTTYAGGVIVESPNEMLVGLPGANAVAFEALPSGKVLRTISTIGAGDWLAIDRATNYLYAVDANGATLQWYGIRGGRPLGFLTNVSGEIALDPGTGTLPGR